jgi:alkylation response protein AidB-like acyl-CoA dehydrogenase
MYFLTDEQKLIQNLVCEFANTEVEPIASEIDKNHRYPHESVQRMAELGIMGMSIPEKFGGTGGDYLSYILAVEQLARVSASHGGILSVHLSVGTHPILKFGDEKQKNKYIPQLASGKMLGAFALTEPDAGSDASAIKTSAKLDGDSYILNGGKIFITNGGYAGIFIVFASTDKSKGIKGLSAFIVERSFPGISIGPNEEKMGMNGQSTTEVYFNDCIVPAENLLGKEGEGFKIAMWALNGGRISVAAQGLGLAQGALDAAIAYSKLRVQFGKPICENQGIQWMLADMAVKVETARLLIYHAARVKDSGEDYSRLSAMAKLYAAQVAVECSRTALQIHGGVGYTKSFAVERFYRDAKVIEIYEGTNEIQRTVIARSLLGK